MTRHFTAVICTCLVLGFVAGELRGQDRPKTGAKPAPAQLTDAEVKSLIKQMGGAKEAERDAAAKKLREAGLAVIPELGKTATQINRQASNHAMEILTFHLDSDDVETRVAAYGALERIATGSRSSRQTAAKKIIDDHKEVKAEWDAARLAAREKRAALAETKPSPPKTNPRPRPAAVSDPATNLRRQGIEQSIKDGEKAIEEIKKLKLPKQLEAQQISAVTQALQKLRAQLKELDGAGRRK